MATPRTHFIVRLIRNRAAFAVSTAAPYFLSDLFEDGGFKHVPMDRPQFGRHQQPAQTTRDSGKALATSSLCAELLSFC
jgi:hypothetical protein